MVNTWSHWCNSFSCLITTLWKRVLGWSHVLSVDVGVGKLASVPAGGAVAVSAAPGSAAPAAGSAPAAGEWWSGKWVAVKGVRYSRCWMGLQGNVGSLVSAYSGVCPQQRKRKTRRRKSPRSQMMTWDLACLIKFLLPCK